MIVTVDGSVDAEIDAVEVPEPSASEDRVPMLAPWVRICPVSTVSEDA